MKIWCDVCGKEEAMVFCFADEAALCESCDRRVHHANKLASKHSRFSLLHPSFKDSPLCDICQERRAFLFCQEDRAILCIECDLSIHRANEHNQKHNRFLLTGVELSSSSNVDSETKSSQSSKRFHSVSDNEIFSSPSTETPLPASTTYRAEDNCTNETASISTSNISEYLMETLPGWHVDDFLEPSSASNGFCKTFEQLLPVKGLSCFSSEEIWVHEVSPPQSSQLSLFIPENDLVDGLKKLKEAKVLNFGCRWNDGESFLVPQISSFTLRRMPILNVCSIRLPLDQGSLFFLLFFTDFLVVRLGSGDGFFFANLEICSKKM